jgi:peptidoglycan/LPS O-acetylase OafA/YrhL
MMVRRLVFDPHDIAPLLGSGLPGQLLFTGCVIVLSLGAAAVSWHVLEKHILKLKRHFPYDTWASESAPLQLSATPVRRAA